MAINVELVSPERILYSGEAEMVICRTVGGGELAFLAGHTPFLGALEIELVRIKTTEGNEEAAAVHAGFVHVRDDNVIILSDVAELASQVDVDRARRAKERAERKDMEDHDEEAEAALARAHVRLRLADQYS
ncbi:MAG: ATP synthase F1 subunit epsilon [Actinomycetota bacterium]|nr:ATP synthase F1 subunit epsilon [Actinomycetota bacterium]